MTAPPTPVPPSGPSASSTGCRLCAGTVHPFLDLGRQPISDAFLRPDELDRERTFRLVMGYCGGCSMVQQLEEVPRETMFHADYPYRSSGSAGMRHHFRQTAEALALAHLQGTDPFVIELGCNDGVMLRHLAAAGVRHLGVEPSGGVAEVARQHGVSVMTEFFDAASARRIVARHGPADLVYAANTFCHIPYAGSIFQGLDEVLRDDGVFVFEDPYLGDVIDRTSFDQIYDEHFFLFSATSVAAMARQFSYELVDVERLGVHGGEVRYTLARTGRRPASPATDALLREETGRRLTDPATLDRFAGAVRTVARDLRHLLDEVRSAGATVAGYGATAKSATVTNFCGIGPDQLAYICDTTPAKQGRLSPGAHIPVVGPERFAERFPDYALLFAWNHADEIMHKEQAFQAAGGRWITYVPAVTVT